MGGNQPNPRPHPQRRVLPCKGCRVRTLCHTLRCVLAIRTLTTKEWALTYDCKDAVVRTESDRTQRCLIYPLISKVDSVLSIPMPSPSKTTRNAETGPITYRMDVLAAVADDFEGMLSDSHVSFNDPQADIP